MMVVIVFVVVVRAETAAASASADYEDDDDCCRESHTLFSCFCRLFCWLLLFGALLLAGNDELHTERSRRKIAIDGNRHDD